MEVCDYATGARLDGDTTSISNGYPQVAFILEGQTAAVNNKLVSSFGAHEARNNAVGYVVYTTLVGIWANILLLWM